MISPYLSDPDFTLYNGDSLAVLRTLPADSVDCCVTSPPYWGLRDYGVEGQLGLEGFEIPLSARAAANRIHKPGVPAQPVADAGERLEWRGWSAHWTRTEKRAVAGLPASELAVIHALKAELDAVLMEGKPEAGRFEGETPSSPS